MKSFIRAEIHSLLLIGITAWIVNFLHFRHFGFYEDDWLFSGGPFGWDFKTWLEFTKHSVLYSSVGRPLQLAIVCCLGYVGKIANSIEISYILCFGMVVVSLVLAYAVLRNRLPRYSATMGVILFAVSPLHSLHQFLNGQFSFAPAFTFLFCAILLFFQRRFVWAYTFALFSLLTYESIFMLFLAAPLLERGNIRDVLTSKRLVIHEVICSALFGIYYCTRLLTGESRVAGLSAHSHHLVLSVVDYGLFYTFGSFRTYFYACAAALRNVSLEGWIYSLCLSIVLAYYLASVLPTLPGRGKTRSLNNSRELCRRRYILRWALGATFVALALLGLGYSLVYFMAGPPLGMLVKQLFLTGRLTKASVSASFGSSLLLAVLFSTILRLCWSTVQRAIVLAVLSIFFCSMFLYGFVVQDSYERSWAQQRSLFAQVISLTPDVQPDSTIILKLSSVGLDKFGGDGPEFSVWYSDYFITNSTALFYRRDQPLPAICVVHLDSWSEYLRKDRSGKLSFPASGFPSKDGPCIEHHQPGRFIVLSETTQGLLERSSTPIMADGIQIVQPEPPNTPKRSNWDSLVPNKLLAHLLLTDSSKVIAQEAIIVKTKPPVTPTIGPVIISSNSRKAYMFTSTFYDANGASDISNIYFMVQSSVNPVKACWLYYSPPAKVAKLASDDGAGWSRELMVGSGTLTNGQCATFGSDWLVQSNNDQLKLVFSLGFKPGFCGSKKIFVFAAGAGNSTIGWQERGTVDLPCTEGN